MIEKKANYFNKQWSAKDELRTLATRGKKLLRSLVVWQWIILYLFARWQRGEQTAAGMGVVWHDSSTNIIH